jgi:hypothetical protein
MATTVREDGRRPRTNRDGQRAQAECRKIEQELGLRRLKSGDLTAAPMPTSAEQAKALRAGATVTAKEWLRDEAYAAAAAARDEAEYFSTLSTLSTLGIKIKYRMGPETGDVTGYSLAAPDDTNALGEPVYFSGSNLAPDLSINRLRERLAAHDVTDQPTARTTGPGPWHHADTALRDLHKSLLDQEAESGQGRDSAVQAQAAAFSELLHNAAATAPAPIRAELRAAATAFNRANRSAIRAEHRSAAALRTVANELLHILGSEEEGSGAAALLSTAVSVAILLARWNETRDHQQQAAAARQTLTHLRTAYQQAAGPVLADLASRTPSPQAAERYATTLHAALPDHAARIMADPSWPALATALAKSESAGQNPRHLLTEIAGQRELDTADHPAEVIIWRLQHQTTELRAARVRAATARPHHSSAAGNMPVAAADTASSRGLRMTRPPALSCRSHPRRRLCFAPWPVVADRPGDAGWAASEDAGRSSRRIECQTRFWSSRMQGPHAYMGACAPATLAGPIHRTRVHCWPQYSQQYPSTHSLPSSVVAGAGRPPRANAAIPGITRC